MSNSNNEIPTLKSSSSSRAETDAVQRDEIDCINEKLDGMRMSKADLFSLEELLNKLRGVNAIFAKQLRINEAKYSSLQRRLEKEVTQLVAIYDELKCCKKCTDLLTLQEACVQNDMKSMEEECRNLRKTEMQELENVVAKQEPALFQTYTLLYRFPERRKTILDGLETRINNKRKALDSLASIIQHKRFLYNMAANKTEEEKPKRPRPVSLLPVVLRRPRVSFRRRNAVADLSSGVGPLPAVPSDIFSGISEWNII